MCCVVLWCGVLCCVVLCDVERASGPLVDEQQAELVVAVTSGGYYSVTLPLPFGRCQRRSRLAWNARVTPHCNIDIYVDTLLSVVRERSEITVSYGRYVEHWNRQSEGCVA
jgi:hypothetical protein